MSTRKDVRRAMSHIADAAIIVCDAIDDSRSWNDDFDAAVATMTRAYDAAMAAYAAIRAANAGTEP